MAGTTKIKGIDARANSLLIRLYNRGRIEVGLARDGSPQARLLDRGLAKASDGRYGDILELTDKGRKRARAILELSR